MALDIDTVFRDNVIKGDIHSGEHDPDKAEIRALLKAISGAAGNPSIVKLTKAALDLVTPASENYGGLVLNDPTASNNGYYYRSSSTWVKGRGLPDTFAVLTSVGGTANAITASVDAGVNPGDVKLMLLVPTAANTGAVTLSVGGESAVSLRDVNGDPLTAGLLAAGRAVLVWHDGTYYRLASDPDADAAAASAAASAAAANTDADRAEVAATEAEGYAAGLNIPAVASGDARKVLRVKEDETGSEWVDRPAEYTGVVASSGYTLSGQTTINKQMMSRTRHRARDNISFPQLVFGNWYVDASGVEQGLGGAATLTASIEYPEGTFYQVKFSGSATGNLADGQTLVSDQVPVLIPDGADFWVRSFFSSATGIVYRFNMDVDLLGGSQYAPSGVSDLTMGGAISYTDAHAFTPLAIIGQTTKPTVMIVGDSRARGSSDTMDAEIAIGNLDRSLAPVLATINAVRDGDRADWAAASHAKRDLLTAYVTDIVIALGINDMRAGRSAAQVETDVETLIAAWADKRVHVATVEPNTTSSDSFATLANQTIDASNTARVAYNAAVRGGLAGAAGYIELADSVESSRDSGKWKVTGGANGYTGDGLHANLVGNKLTRDLRVVDPTRFLRIGDTPPFRLANIGDVRRRASGMALSPFALFSDQGETAPSVIGLSVNGLADSYSVRIGKWLRFGPMVYIEVALAWPGHSGSGAMAIADALPFTVDGSPLFNVSFVNLTYSTSDAPQVKAAVSGTNIIFLAQTSGGGVNSISLDTAATLYVTGWYMTADE